RHAPEYPVIAICPCSTSKYSESQNPHRGNPTDSDFKDGALARMPKPEGQSVLWGVNRHPYLVQQKHALYVLSFPVYDPVPWNNISALAEKCPATLQRVTYLIESSGLISVKTMSVFPSPQTSMRAYF
ncbi:hypothetical protein, partial [Halovulum sp. GXIMD14793]